MRVLNFCFVVALFAATVWEVNSLPTGSIKTTYNVTNKSGRYVLSANPTTWDEAIDECIKQQFSLVTIMTKAEAEELRESFGGQDLGGEFWIAGIFDGTSSCLAGNWYDTNCWYWKGNDQNIERLLIGVDFDNKSVKPTKLSRVIYIPNGRSAALAIENVTALKRFVCQTF